MEQYCISVHGKTEKVLVARELEAYGFRNIIKTYKEYLFPVIVVQKDCFFGSNICCMAALVSGGGGVITWEQFETLFSKYGMKLFDKTDDVYYIGGKGYEVLD